jgi:hypothetical protein
MKNFSNILLVFIAISAISFSSCKKKIDPIVGTWNFVEAKPNFTSSNPLVSMFGNSIDISTFIEMPNPLILNEDGTGSGTTSSGTTQFNYINTDSQITFKNMMSFVGGSSNEDLIADYQLLDKNKTLKITIDATKIAVQMLEDALNSGTISLPLPIDIESLISSIIKIEVTATYKK